MSCRRTKSWGKTFNFPDGSVQQYAVTLKPSGCFPEKYDIKVNGQQIDHELTCNFCSPVLFSGGVYEWQQDRHSFMLIYNSLGLMRHLQGYRLIIDGIDVESGMEFRRFFKSRGLQFIVLGSALILFGAAPLLLTTLGIMDTEIFGNKQGMFVLSAVGLVLVVMGLVPCIKRYPDPRFMPLNYNNGLNA